MCLDVVFLGKTPITLTVLPGGSHQIAFGKPDKILVGNLQWTSRLMTQISHFFIYVQYKDFGKGSGGYITLTDIFLTDICAVRTDILPEICIVGTGISAVIGVVGTEL